MAKKNGEPIRGAISKNWLKISRGSEKTTQKQGKEMHGFYGELQVGRHKGVLKGKEGKRGLTGRKYQAQKKRNESKKRTSQCEGGGPHQKEESSPI